MTRPSPKSLLLLRAAAAAAAATLAAAPVASAQAAPRGILLQDLTWVQAESVLTSRTVVVIPLGAAAKEHGPHLRLDNDHQLAAYFARRVLAAADVVVAPTITYHFYPAFLEYPGSTHLRFETARDLVVDIVTSLARHGPRRFYVLNTGVSTQRPLAAAAALLQQQGITLRYTDILTAAGDAEDRVRQQEAGTHADEIETSMMLYMDPGRVDMRLARRDLTSLEGRGALTRVPGGPGVYSPTGIWGDATLATVEKGRVVVEAMVATILRDIEALRAMP